MRMLQNSVKVKRNRKYINITKQDLHHMFLFPFFPCFQDGMDLVFGFWGFFFVLGTFTWNFSVFIFTPFPSFFSAYLLLTLGKAHSKLI